MGKRIFKATGWSGRGQRGVMIFLTAGIMALLALPTPAATDREPIDEIHLIFESDIETGGSSSEVEVTTEDDEYSVEGVEVVNASGDWAGGVRPRLEIYLCAEDRYYFSDTTEEMFEFSGDDAEYVSAKKRERGTELVLTVRLKALDREDLSVDGVRWNKRSGAATWEENPAARGYEVRLYRGNDLVTSLTLRSSSETSCYFFSQMKESGNYYFEVCAIGSGSQRGEWETSNEWSLSASGINAVRGNDSSDQDEKELISPSTSSKPQAGYYSDEEFDPEAEYEDREQVDNGPGATSKEGSGKSSDSEKEPVIATREGEITQSTRYYWNEDEKGWWFHLSDGSWLKNTWAKIDGVWYCFDETGYLRYGWIFSGGNWYYCGDDGGMLINARTPDGYFVGGDGVWIQ